MSHIAEILRTPLTRQMRPGVVAIPRLRRRSTESFFFDGDPRLDPRRHIIADYEPAFIDNPNLPIPPYYELDFEIIDYNRIPLPADRPRPRSHERIRPQRRNRARRQPRPRSPEPLEIVNWWGGLIAFYRNFIEYPDTAHMRTFVLSMFALFVWCGLYFGKMGTFIILYIPFLILVKVGFESYRWPVPWVDE